MEKIHSAPAEQSLSQLVKGIRACAAMETDKMLALYQNYVRRKLSATSVTWLAAYRGEYGRSTRKAALLKGWKVMEVIVPVDSEADTEADQEEYFRLAHKHGIDPLTELAIKRAGKTRVHRYSEATNEAAWSENWIKREYLDKRNIGERMLGVYYLSAEAESYLMVDRAVGTEPFNRQDEQALYQLLDEFPRLHYWLFLERGLVKPSRRPFTPRQRELIKLMLGPNSEKELALATGLSAGTVHNYIGEIYQNLNVSSRAEMMHLWLASIPIFHL